MTERDENGRFLTGHEGLPDAGRPKGSRQSLSDQFIADLSDLWEREGRNVLAQMAGEKPCELVRAVTKGFAKGRETVEGGRCDGP